MNVIVSNLNGDKFNHLDIDVIKSISGEFTVDEIIQSFSNFFFNRMFLDITAIQDYGDVTNLKKLSVGLDVSKVILLLSDDPVVNDERYISNLVSMGIYNFAHNEDELRYLYNNPNSYKDVAQLQRMDDMTSNISSTVGSLGVRVIGVKNFTSHAGATSFIYMLKKVLSTNYYTVAIEVNKRDFMFYNDEDMVSCKAKEISNMIQKYQNASLILVDVNDLEMSTMDSVCGEVIYLMESSTLMINKAVMLDNDCFSKLFNKKVILNQSLLNEKDAKRLQREAGIIFFGVVPPLNDRLDNSQVLYPLLERLGLYKRV